MKTQTSAVVSSRSGSSAMVKQKNSSVGSSYNPYTTPLYTYLKTKQASEFVYSHTSISGGKYYIPNECMSEFMELYYQHVFVSKYPAHLTEGIRDCEYTPIKIDFDMRYYRPTLERIYTIDQIGAVCQSYIRTLEEYLENIEDEERDFYVMEKSSPTFDIKTVKSDDKITMIEQAIENADGHRRIKDGFHIVAPRLITNVNLQLKCRTNVLKLAPELMKDYRLENSFYDAFDISVITTNNWQMYGSSKPNKEAYRVSHILRVWKDRYEVIPTIPTDRELVDLLSMRNKDIYNQIKSDKENEVFQIPVEQSGGIKAPGRKRKVSPNALPADMVKTVCEYVDALSATRASTYRPWIEVGWCLHNLHNKDEVLLEKWIEFSKKDPRYGHTADTECRDLWDKMDDTGLGIGSLKLWVKHDNYEAYKQMIQHDISHKIYKLCKGGRGNPVDFADLIYTMYHDYYICVSNKNDTWYYYSDEENRWVLDDRGIILRKKISSDVFQELIRVQMYKNQQSLESGDDNNEEAVNIGKVANRLKETSVKNNIMSECKERFYDTKRAFINKLDSYTHLIGFKNGVYDLRRKEFRQGRPEDFVSMSTNINYVPYRPDEPEFKEIWDFLKSVFVIKSVREYILIRMSSFLSGSTRDETFDVWSGRGGNGKSKLVELTAACMGDYAGNLPVSLLTMKRAASNAATPELARTKGKRMVVMQEPDTKTKLNVGLMKELTGGDKIQARALFNEPFEFKPQFKLILCANDKPELPSHDDGTWRRLRNTEFISRFRAHPEADKVLDFKKNTSISEKMDTWAEAFMSLLIEYHGKYEKHGLVLPDEISEYTNEYRAVNDHFREFVNDCFENDPASTEVITIEKIYPIYTEWYKNSHGDGKSRKKRDLLTYLTDAYGDYWPAGVSSGGKGFKGFRIKEQEPEHSSSSSVLEDVEEDEEAQPVDRKETNSLS